MINENVVYMWFLIRLVSNVMLSDTRSYSHHIIKQGIVITLRCFPVNLQYVISIISIENDIAFATIYTGSFSFYTYK